MTSLHVAESLTGEQSCRAAFDLAVGYPMLPMPDELRDVVIEATRRTMAEPVRAHGRSDDTAEAVCAAAGNLLGVPHHLRSRMRVTFSGSVAVDRALRAAGTLGGAAARAPVRVVLTEPCPDFIVRMVAERYGPAMRLVRRRDVQGPADDTVTRLLAAIRDERARDPGSHVIVLLVSPENPTGNVTTADGIEAIARECSRSSAVLVLDHCFAMAGVHAPHPSPTVWNVPTHGCSWIGIWDTGKTLDVGGDKLGFVLSGDDAVLAQVDLALSSIQVGPSRLAGRIFGELLASPDLARYIAEVGHICRRNIERLRSALGAGAGAVHRPTAGSVTLVDPAFAGVNAHDLRRRWLAAGVNTVTTAGFFEAAPDPDADRVRVALARPEEYFDGALRLLVTGL